MKNHIIANFWKVKEIHGVSIKKLPTYIQKKIADVMKLRGWY